MASGTRFMHGVVIDFYNTNSYITFSGFTGTLTNLETIIVQIPNGY